MNFQELITLTKDPNALILFDATYETEVVKEKGSHLLQLCPTRPYLLDKDNKFPELHLHTPDGNILAVAFRVIASSIEKVRKLRTVLLHASPEGIKTSTSGPIDQVIVKPKAASLDDLLIYREWLSYYGLLVAETFWRKGN